jgi:hypothetical protein
MNFNQNDLRQLDEDYIDVLDDSGDLASFTSRVIQDLKELWERVDQNPGNSSRPSGSMPPWEKWRADNNASGTTKKENAIEDYELVDPSDLKSNGSLEGDDVCKENTSTVDQAPEKKSPDARKGLPDIVVRKFFPLTK